MFDSFALTDIKDSDYKNSGLCGFCLVKEFNGDFDIKRFSKHFAKKPTDVYSGIEIAFEYSTHESLAMQCAGLETDYTVNTVNTVDGISLSEFSYYTARTRNDAYRKYLEKVFDSLDAAYDYSVISAPAQVSFNTFYPSPQLMYREFPEILDSILMRLVFTGKGLEVNASGFDIFSSPLPSPCILKRYRELNGEIITVGSHASAGKNIKKSYDFLSSCGFKYVSVFKHGICEMVKI